MKSKSNAVNEAFACVIVCALAVSLSLICAGGWIFSDEFKAETIVEELQK